MAWIFMISMEFPIVMRFVYLALLAMAYEGYCVWHVAKKDFTVDLYSHSIWNIDWNHNENVDSEKEMKTVYDSCSDHFI